MPAKVEKQTLYLQYRPHRPVVVRRRLVWRPLNAVQAWLEGRDKPASKLVAYVLLAVAAVFLVAQLVRWSFIYDF